MNINWKGPVVIAVLSMIAITVVQQGGEMVIETFDENTWDAEVQEQLAPLKRVIEPVVKSTQSLAIDRKEALRDNKLELLESIAQTEETDYTREQELIVADLIAGIEELDEEIDELEEQYELPVFEPIEDE